MDINELRKMTILQLREEAHKFPDIQGVSGMKKEVLLKILMEKHGIKDTGPTGNTEYKRQIKAKIKQLKRERTQALQAEEAIKATRLRRRIKQLKRKTRKLSKMIKVTPGKSV
jgi:hypothetical protein